MIRLIGSRWPVAGGLRGVGVPFKSYITFLQNLDKSYIQKLHPKVTYESYIAFVAKVTHENYTGFQVKVTYESYKSYIDLKVTHDSYI